MKEYHIDFYFVQDNREKWIREEWMKHPDKDEPKGWQIMYLAPEENEPLKQTSPSSVIERRRAGVIPVLILTLGILAVSLQKNPKSLLSTLNNLGNKLRENQSPEIVIPTADKITRMYLEKSGFLG